MFLGVKEPHSILQIRFSISVNLALRCGIFWRTISHYSAAFLTGSPCVIVGERSFHCGMIYFVSDHVPDVQLKHNDMKKIIFSIVGSMLISLCVVQAQERSDTTGTASQDRQQKSQKYEKSPQQSDRTRHQGDAQASQRQGDRSQYPDDYANEGMVIIDKSEMPPALKQQLQQKKYAGWENGTIYHNTSTGEYVIAPRAYRFDAQGKEMEMGSSPAYGNREGRYSPGDRDAQSQSRTRESQTDQTQSQQGQRTQGQQDQQDPGRQNQSAQDQADNTDQSDNAQSSQTQQSRDVDQAQQSQGQQNPQQPSAGYRTDRNNRSDANTESNTSTQSQAGQPSQSQYRTEDMVEVQAEQIPASLRRTLSESQYRGWEENGTLYQDPSGNEYVLEMQSTTDASQPRVYRFDKNGQLKPGQNGTGNNDQ
jgi:hypothetical protein